ncbi:MAG: hypothetical protein JXB32_19800 [Deltaproteobacteria bacterium]|nr:hypothetical protein [Deltaproteobacteria bacterium]
MRLPWAAGRRRGAGRPVVAPPSGARALLLSFVLAVQLVPSASRAWVSAYLERVETEVVVEPDGRAAITVTAWQSIEAGRFREFELRDVPLDVELDVEASAVEDGQGRVYPVESWGKRRDDGILRLRLAGEAGIPKGRATCRIVLRQDWVGGGVAVVRDGALNIGWTPPAWPDGMERLTVRVRFAGDAPLEFALPEGLATELEPRAEGRMLVLSRFRPAAFYRMPVRFTARAAGAGPADALLTAAPAPPAPERPHRSRPPAVGSAPDLLPFLVVLPLLGLLLLGGRARHARQAALREGGVQAYLLLPSLGAPLRWPWAGVALAAGAWMLWTGELLGGFAVQAAGLLLVLPDRFRWLERPVPGAGPWRVLAAPSPRTWRSLVAAARRARRSWLDPTGPAGLTLLLLLGGAVAGTTATVGGADPRVWLVVVAEAALLLLPPFLVASERALPPVLPGESGTALERVRRALRRTHPPSPLDVAFLVQDDAAGRPAELRMRVRRPAASVARVAEVAVEWSRSRWGWHPTYAVLLELPTGSRLRAGETGFPRDATCRIADDLDRELWVFRTPTARSAAVRLVRALESAERVLTVGAPVGGEGADRPTRAAA